jgi:aspartyl protease family protein
VQGRVVVGDLELVGGVRAERLRITALPQLHAPLLGMDVLGRLPLQQQRNVLRIELGGVR